MNHFFEKHHYYMQGEIQSLLLLTVAVLIDFYQISCSFESIISLKPLGICSSDKSHNKTYLNNKGYVLTFFLDFR
jgi:hypothetical protein